MSEFVYLYRGQPMSPRSPEETQKSMSRWMAWFAELEKGGHLKDRGQPLEGTGKVVRSTKSVTDGPFVEAKDVVGGFTIVSAKNVGEAADLTKGCPILENGGSVEVRPIMKM